MAPWSLAELPVEPPLVLPVPLPEEPPLVGPPVAPTWDPDAVSPLLLPAVPLLLTPAAVPLVMAPPIEPEAEPEFEPPALLGELLHATARDATVAAPSEAKTIRFSKFTETTSVDEPFGKIPSVPGEHRAGPQTNAANHEIDHEGRRFSAPGRTQRTA